MINQFILYVLFAGTAAASNIGLRWFLSHIGLQFWLSICLAYLTGMFINFSLNKFFNFKQDNRKTIFQAQTFFILAVIGLIFTEAISHLILIQFVAVQDYLYGKDLAHIAAVGMVMIYSFLAHRYITFNGGIRYRIQQFHLNRSKIKKTSQFSNK